ncbi:MAG: biotin transporter BioY [Lachnospiraceae bacterium]|nr:biotin transporter BioY [Lachnospiraceae bacterium]
MKQKITIKEMTLCAIFTALTAVGAFIKIPIPNVPFTLQFLFTMLAGLLLGGRLGAVSVGAYALLGLAGLPIFAEGGGFWYLLKPSFGYIIGFIIGSYVTGKMTEKREHWSFGRILAANFAGLAIVYGMGMIYYYIICNFVIDTPIALWPLFLYCFVLAVPGDIFLCFVAALLAKRVKPIIADMQ